MFMDWNFVARERFCVSWQHGGVCAVCSIRDDVVFDDVDVIRDAAARQCFGASY